MLDSRSDQLDTHSRGGAARRPGTKAGAYWASAAPRRWSNCGAKVPKLTSKEIVGSLRRLDVRVESPTALPERKGRPEPSSTKKKPGDGERKTDKKKNYEAKLLDIIGALLLSPPLKLFRKYRGKMMEATLLVDGAVEFEEVRYDSCSAAAEFARSTVTGRKMNTNGWSFWQFVDPEGKKRTLFDARQRFLSMKGHAP